MAVNFQCNAPVIQLGRNRSIVSVHLTFDSVAEAKQYFVQLETDLETKGQIILSFISDGPVNKQ